MFCPQCDTQVPNNARFCANCGGALGSSAIVQRSSSPTASAPNVASALRAMATENVKPKDVSFTTRDARTHIQGNNESANVATATQVSKPNAPATRSSATLSPIVKWGGGFIAAAIALPFLLILFDAPKNTPVRTNIAPVAVPAAPRIELSLATRIVGSWNCSSNNGDQTIDTANTALTTFLANGRRVDGPHRRGPEWDYLGILIGSPYVIEVGSYIASGDQLTTKSDGLVSMSTLEKAPSNRLPDYRDVVLSIDARTYTGKRLSFKAGTGPVIDAIEPQIYKCLKVATPAETTAIIQRLQLE